MNGLTDRDISDLEKSYAKCPGKTGGVFFGIQHTKKIKSLMHWVQDFTCVDEIPTFKDLDKEYFKRAIAVAAQRSLIRDKESKDASAVSEEASPGKLKDERKWTDWIAGFENMLSTILGVNGVPLSYVIREKEATKPEGHNTLVQKCIACAPLTGPHFEADARKVYQLATYFTRGETSEQWIKMNAKKQNSCLDLKALYAHYQGVGNTTRRIGKATRLRETLHYKNEPSLLFATFLSKVQHMFNLFEEEDEPLTEGAKFRFLMYKVNRKELQTVIEALRVCDSLEAGRATTFTEAENVLAASVAILTETVAKSRISGLSQPDTGTSNNDSIYLQGKIFTGYYKFFNKLSKEDQGKVLAERERLNIKKGSSEKKIIATPQV